MSARWKRTLADLAALSESLRTAYPHAHGAPNRDQWDDWWQTADRVRKALTVDGPELIRRAAETSVDGYGSQSGAVGPGSKGTVSDPTGRLVATKLDREAEGGTLDPVRANVIAMVHHTGAAVAFFRIASGHVGADDTQVLRYVDYGIRRLVKAAAHRAKALPPVVVEEKPVDGCTHCAKFDVYDRIHKAGLCRADYEYLRRHDGNLPPPELVRARDGRRVDRELEKKAGGR